MRQACRALSVVAVLAGAGLLPPAASAAQAGPVIQAQIAALTSSTRVITYPGTPVTVTGTLETVVPNGQTPQGLPGETVSLGLTDLSGVIQDDLGTVTTDASGNFTATVTPDTPGHLQASFAGDGTYAAATGHGPWISATSTMPTRITVDPVTPVPYGALTPVTVHVAIQKPDGTWVPARAMVTICNYQRGWTGADGTFTAQLRAEATPCTAAITTTSPAVGWTSYASAQLIIPLTTFPTQIASFQPAGLVGGLAPANDITFSGIAQYTDEAGVVHPYPDAPVQLLYVVPRSSLTEFTTTADSTGAFRFTGLSAYSWWYAGLGGMWEAVIQDNGSHLGSPVVQLPPEEVLVPVRIQHLRFRRAARHSYLTGTLTYRPENLPLHGVRVTLRIRDSRGRTRYGPSVTTNSLGQFRIPTTVPARGHSIWYAAVYAGGPLPGWTGPGPGWASSPRIQSNWLRLHHR